MNTGSLKMARERRGWTQVQAADKMGLSQTYLSLLEKGKRSLTWKLAEKFVRVYGMSPSQLPLLPHSDMAQADEEKMVYALSTLGYPGYSYLGKSKKHNPAEVLFAALSNNNLDPRVMEALPWLVMTYYDMNWEWLLVQVKTHDLQNRLGYVTMLARQLAEYHKMPSIPTLIQWELALERARLVKEDTLCLDSMTSAEKRWLTSNRPQEARHWNLFTDLTMKSLPYAC